MKRMKLLILILMIFTNCRAPEWKSFFIVESKPIHPVERLIYAIGMVEGNCNTFAYNPIENAAGYFQIRPIRLKDYNQRTGKNYKTKDLYDFNISKEIFCYYISSDEPYNAEKIAKSWNGSGPLTEIYWRKVKLYL